MSEQKSEVWHEERRHNANASEIAGILGLSPWNTEWEIWATKTGRLEPWAGDTSTSFGHWLEPPILDYAEAQLGPMQRQVQLSDPQGSRIRATLDGRLWTGGNPVEAKTSGIVGPIYGHWGPDGSDNFPSYYVVQLHAQLLCSGADVGYLFALLGGRGIVRYELKSNAKFHDWLREQVNDWWERHVIADTPPDMTAPPSLDVLKRLRHETGKAIVADAELVEAINQFELAKEHASEARDRVDAYQREILLRLDDAERALLPDGRELTYLESERKGYTVQPTKYRTLRLKKG